MHITRVDGSMPIRLEDVDPDGTGEYASKEEARALLKVQRKRMRAAQERLYAEGEQSLLVILQATDTGGKDGTIRNVFKGVNPQGCRVWSFGVPTSEEASHDVLWRYHRRAPARGMIGVFNRSHYEEVLAVRVRGIAPETTWRSHYPEIRNFEELLVNNRTRILKFFLHISRDEQRKRLQDRLDEPTKHWKFRNGDLEDRALWDEYQVAFEDAINECATPRAPWFVVPANRKWYRNLVVARTIADTMEDMDPQWPEPEVNVKTMLIPN